MTEQQSKYRSDYMAFHASIHSTDPAYQMLVEDAARIAELESELDFQNQCRDGYRSERDMLKKDLEFAYKRAKVLADICKIPVHESPEVTGTILGLVRSHVERLESDARIMAEELLCFHPEKDFCVVNSAGDRLWRKGPCDCHACIIAAKYREGESHEK